MTIAEPEESSKVGFWQPGGVGFTIGVLILTASASFGLGMLTEKNIQIGQATSSFGSDLSSGPTVSSFLPEGAASTNALSTTTSGGTPIPAGGQVIGSNSTHQYYLPWCPQASSIGSSDTVWFTSQQEAQTKGFTPGKGCPGL